MPNEIANNMVETIHLLEKELEETKRLLKQAVTAMNNGSCTANCYNCKHIGSCDFSQRFEWKHTDEVDKLLKQ